MCIEEKEITKARTRTKPSECEGEGEEAREGGGGGPCANPSFLITLALSPSLRGREGRKEGGEE